MSDEVFVGRFFYFSFHSFLSPTQYIPYLSLASCFYTICFLCLPNYLYKWVLQKLIFSVCVILSFISPFMFVSLTLLFLYNLFHILFCSFLCMTFETISCKLLFFLSFLSCFFSTFPFISLKSLYFNFSSLFLPLYLYFYNIFQFFL